MREKPLMQPKRLVIRQSNLKVKVGFRGCRQKKTGEYANKAEYARAKADALKEAYDLAYNQVMDLYHERIQAEINGYNNQTAEDILVDDTLGSKGMQFSVNLSGNDNQITPSRGCAGMATLLVAGVGALSYLIYELVNLV
jgi:hypothetical protein